MLAYITYILYLCENLLITEYKYKNNDAIIKGFAEKK